MEVRFNIPIATFTLSMDVPSVSMSYIPVPMRQPESMYRSRRRYYLSTIGQVHVPCRPGRSFSQYVGPQLFA